jgi:N utilization substance protein B
VTAKADEIIAENAIGWTLARMPVIDLIVLRIAIFELMSRPDVPTAVILNEAVELAKTFSTDESGRFVNGILSTIAKKVRL